MKKNGKDEEAKIEVKTTDECKSPISFDWNTDVVNQNNVAEDNMSALTCNY